MLRPACFLSGQSSGQSSQHLQRKTLQLLLPGTLGHFSSCSHAVPMELQAVTAIQMHAFCYGNKVLLQPTRCHCWIRRETLGTTGEVQAHPHSCKALALAVQGSLLLQVSRSGVGSVSQGFESRVGWGWAWGWCVGRAYCVGQPMCGSGSANMIAMHLPCEWGAVFSILLCGQA